MSVCKIASGSCKASSLPRLQAAASDCARAPLVRQQDGAAAIEFGLVAAPFLALMFAIIETAIVFFAGQALETAAADSARLIMTGQAQTQGFDQAKFKQAVCAKIYGLFDCAGGLYVDVKNYSSFASVNTSKPIDGNGNLQTGNFGYQPGGPGNIVVVRLMYQWPVYVSLLGLNLVRHDGRQAPADGDRRVPQRTVSMRQRHEHA